MAIPDPDDDLSDFDPLYGDDYEPPPRDPDAEAKPDQKWVNKATPLPWAKEKSPLDPTPRLKVFYVDYPAGSHKTTRAVKYAMDRAYAEGEQFIMAFPTRKLMDQAYENAKAFNTQYALYIQAVMSFDRDEEGQIVINKDTKEYAVKSARQRLKQLLQIIPIGVTESGNAIWAKEPRVIFCTHRAIRLIGDALELRKWHLIMDEVIEPVETATLRFLPDTIDNLSNRLQPWTGVLPEYAYFDGREEAKEKYSLDNVVENANSDDLFKLILPLAEPIVMGGRAFMSEQAWLRGARLLPLGAGPRRKKKDADPDGDAEPFAKRGELHFSIIYTPEWAERFKTLTVMSAALKATFLYRAWEHRFNVRWVKHPSIRGSYEKHDMMGREVIIGYLNEHMLTKARRDEWPMEHENKPLLEAVIETAEEWFDLTDLQKIEDTGKYEDRRAAYLWVANLDQKDKDLPPSSLRERMPNVSHGRNSWRWVNQCLFFSALNPTSHAGRFMRKTLDMTDEEILIARTYTTVYQAIMRTSLRNHAVRPDTPEFRKPVKILVPDQKCAEWLAGFFENCLGGAGPQIERVGDLKWAAPGQTGRPRMFEEPLSNAEKQKRAREKQRAEDPDYKKKQADDRARRRAKEKENPIPRPASDDVVERVKARAKLVAKVKKLLALADDGRGNPHEAESAREKAHGIMDEHNLWNFFPQEKRSEQMGNTR